MGELDRALAACETGDAATMQPLQLGRVQAHVARGGCQPQPRRQTGRPLMGPHGGGRRPGWRWSLRWPLGPSCATASQLNDANPPIAAANLTAAAPPVPPQSRRTKLIAAARDTDSATKPDSQNSSRQVQRHRSRPANPKPAPTASAASRAAKRLSPRLQRSPPRPPDKERLSREASRQRRRHRPIRLLSAPQSDGRFAAPTTAFSSTAGGCQWSATSALATSPSPTSLLSTAPAGRQSSAPEYGWDQPTNSAGPCGAAPLGAALLLRRLAPHIAIPGSRAEAAQVATPGRGGPTAASALPPAP